MARTPSTSRRSPPVPPVGDGDTDGFRVGPFVLETLTTGMYEGSNNALREYVQNAYDATMAAVDANLLAEGEGEVVVTLPDGDTLVVADNGVGLSLKSAWSTLTAIGASRKDRARDAGFRGIGRLAAIAFCDELSFRTKAVGERRASVVTFDCKELRKGMLSSDPATTLDALLRKAVRLEVDSDAEEDDHFMVVTLRGLKGAPESMRSVDDVRAYLAETSPIGFDPQWVRGREIVANVPRGLKPFVTVGLRVGRTEETAAAVYKPYSDTYLLAKRTRATGGTTQLQRVDYHRGADWWGWIGVPRDVGLLAEGPTTGIRVRMKNIQVDGTAILDRLFAEERESYERFNKYHVGEIHVDPGAVIPNARRDGFEDDDAWRAMRESIYRKVCAPLSKEAYERSETGKKTVESIKGKVVRLGVQVERHFKVAEPTTAAWATTVAKVEKVRAEVAAAVSDADPEATVPLRAQLDVVQRMKDRLENNLEPDAEARLRREIRTEFLEVVERLIQPYLETSTYLRLRKQLRERLR